MKIVRAIFDYIRRSNILKYVVVFVCAIIIIGFADENSAWNHFHNKQKISELKSEIERYTAEYERDNARIRELERNPKSIEKIARERYFMKKDDEDIFVLSDDNPDAQTPINETTE